MLTLISADEDDEHEIEDPAEVAELFSAMAETALDFFTVDDLIRMLLQAAETRMKEAN